MTPFYEKARSLWQSVQNAQILKGLKKYPEPFNPNSWTPDELLNHALEETVDLTHYLVGLKELLDERDAIIEKQKHAISENCDLRKEIERLKDELEYYRKKQRALGPKKSPFEEEELKKSITYKQTRKSPYEATFDPDDQ